MLNVNGRFPAALIIVLSAAIPLCAQNDTVPVDQVRTGMTGIVKTTLSGVEVEEISAEVLGVLHHFFGPERHVIIIKLTGEQVEFQGVANGMSGSPFYLNGKLVGALSTRMGWFAKEPIAGVTPISNMLDAQYGGRGQPKVSLDYQKLWSGNPEIRRLADVLGRRIPSEQSKEIEPLPAGTHSPLLTISHSSLDPLVVERFAPLFRRLGLELSTSVTIGSGAEIPDGPLEPGMPVMIELIGGDMSLGSSGTITHIEGKRIWAFGHPIYLLGSVEWPMARAEVVTVFPSMQGSFNITNTGPEIGAFVQDRASAAYGELDRKAVTIPLEIEVMYGGEVVAKYRYAMARDILLTPALIDLAVSNSLIVTQKQYGEMSVALTGSIALDGYEEVKINNFFTGFNILSQAGSFPAAVFFFLSNNEFAPVDVKGIELTLDFVEKQSIAELQRAWLTKTDVKPGEDLELVMELKPRRGKAFTLKQSYSIPPTLQAGTYKLTVGNGEAITKQETELVKGTMKLKDITHMVRLINSLRPNYKLYVQVYREEEGFYYQGEFFPGLPPSALTVIRANKGDDNFVRLLGTIVDERKMDTEYLVQGVKKLSFTVRR